MGKPHSSSILLEVVEWFKEIYYCSCFNLVVEWFKEWLKLVLYLSKVCKLASYCCSLLASYCCSFWFCSCYIVCFVIVSPSWTKYNFSFIILKLSTFPERELLSEYIAKSLDVYRHIFVHEWKKKSPKNIRMDTSIHQKKPQSWIPQ